MPEIAWREALNQALSEEMERDVNVFLMGEEVARYNGAYKVSRRGCWTSSAARGWSTRRSASSGFAGLGVGAAMVGLRPVIEMMTWNFAILAMDQIVNNAAKLRHMSGGQLRCPIVFRGPNGAGGRLSSQHSQSLEANYAHFPGLKVLAPVDPGRRQGPAQGGHPRRQPGHLPRGRAALRRQGRGARRASTCVPIGKADLKREGKDVDASSPGRGCTTSPSRRPQLLEQEGIHVGPARPAHAQAARRGGHPRLGAEDQPGGGGRGGLELLPASARRSPTSSSRRRSTTSTRRWSGCTGLDVNWQLRRECWRSATQPCRRSGSSPR